MEERKAQLTENWKTHFLCSVLTELSTDKRVHSISSWVIHLTIVRFPWELFEILFDDFAQMSQQLCYPDAVVVFFLFFFLN